MNFLIETKQEYTIHLVNSIYPLIFEGLQNIYEEAKKTAKNKDELKIFQILLTNVPKWNPNIIDSEYQRILRMNSLGKTVEDLLKAVIKANLVVLTNTNIEYDKQLLQDLNIQDDFRNFIHLVYIECARTFYNTPFLFSHRDPPLEIKRNQTETLKIIQECIKNAVRKMIPLQITIKTYLENRNSKVAVDLQSESKQIKNLLQSEKFKKTDVTPSSPRALHEILATTINSEREGNLNNLLLKDNSQVINFSEKTLRDSILKLNTEQEPKSPKKENPFIFNKPKPKFNNMSESSVYYDGGNNVIEEYSNLNLMSPLRETDNGESDNMNGGNILSNSEKNKNIEKNAQNIQNTGKNFKYFSNFNV